MTTKKPIPDRVATTLERYLIHGLVYDGFLHNFFTEVYRSDFDRKDVYDFLAMHYEKQTSEADLFEEFHKAFPKLDESLNKEKIQAHEDLSNRGSIPAVGFRYLLYEVRKESKKRLIERIAALTDFEDQARELREFDADSHGIEDGKHKLETFTVADLMKKELPPLEEIIPQILPEGLTVLSGKPKTGKSYLVMDWGLAIAHGGLAMGQLPCKQGSVLYMALEGNERLLKERLTTLGRYFERETSSVTNLEIALRAKVLDKGGYEQIEGWIKGHPDAKLAIIDTYQKVKPMKRGNIDDYDAAVETLGRLQEIANEKHISILIVHHNTKAKTDDDFDAILGTTGIRATTDTNIVLNRTRGGDDSEITVLSIESRQGIPEGRYAYRFREADTPVILLLGDADEYSISKERAEVLELLKSDPGLTPSQIGDALGKKNITPLLQKMRKAGQVISKKGKYELYQ